jgi:hypothetical protein
MDFLLSELWRAQGAVQLSVAGLLQPQFPARHDSDWPISGAWDQASLFPWYYNSINIEI